MTSAEGLLCTRGSVRSSRAIVSFRIFEFCRVGIIGPNLQMKDEVFEAPKSQIMLPASLSW